MKFDKSLHIHAYFLNNQLISIKSKYPSSSFLLIAVKYVFNVYKSGITNIDTNSSYPKSPYIHKNTTQK